MKTVGYDIQLQQGQDPGHPAGGSPVVAGRGDVIGGSGKWGAVGVTRSFSDPKLWGGPVSEVKGG